MVLPGGRGAGARSSRTVDGCRAAVTVRLLQAKVPPDLNDSTSFVTVQRMQRRRTAAVTSVPRPARGSAASRCAPGRRREHRLRRFALLTLVALVAVVTLALTAFDGSSAQRVSAITPAPAQRLLPAKSPQPQVIAKLGDLRLQLPVSPSRVTAIGYHAAGDGSRAGLTHRRQANEGLLARLGHKLFGGSSSGAGLVPDLGRQGAPTRAGSTSARARARRSTRPSTDASSASRLTS